MITIQSLEATACCDEPLSVRPSPAGVQTHCWICGKFTYYKHGKNGLDLYDPGAVPKKKPMNKKQRRRPAWSDDGQEPA